MARSKGVQELSKNTYHKYVMRDWLDFSKKKTPHHTENFYNYHYIIRNVGNYSRIKKKYLKTVIQGVH